MKHSWLVYIAFTTKKQRTNKDHQDNKYPFVRTGSHSHLYVVNKVSKEYSDMNVEESLILVHSECQNLFKMMIAAAVGQAIVYVLTGMCGDPSDILVSGVCLLIIIQFSPLHFSQFWSLELL